MDHSRREKQRVLRHKRIRKKIVGTSTHPRLCVHRSLTNFYAQIIDDSKGKVLFALSTQAKDMRNQVKYGGNIKAAVKLGEMFSLKAQEKGFKKVCFDRGGYLYHGRVKAFAEAAREKGMEF